MKIEIRRIGTVDVFTPSGALVDQDADTFCRKLMARVSAEGGSARVGVAMQEVPYLDSAALCGLLEAGEAMQSRGAVLKLAGVTGVCREILELTGLSGRFRLFGDVEDMVKSFLT